MARIASPTAADDERGERDPVAIPRPITARADVTVAGRPVADAADGGDVARPLGVVAELVAQPPDVDVDGPVEDVGLVLAVDRVEQLVAGQDAAVGLEERLEQPELDAGQRDRLAVAGRPRGGRGRRRGRPWRSGARRGRRRGGRGGRRGAGST